MSAFQHTVKCDCAGTCEIGLITLFEPRPHIDKDERWEGWLSFYRRPAKPYLSWRLKHAWGLLCGRYHDVGDIVLSPQTTRDLHAFLDDIVKRMDSEES